MQTRGCPILSRSLRKGGESQTRRNQILTAADPPIPQPKLRPEEPHAWQRPFYDFNLRSERKRIENLRHMHRNPMKRGLPLKPEQWHWSSDGSYAYHEQGRPQIDQWPKVVIKVRAVA